MTRTITAYYDSRSEAQLAADRLAHAGVPRTSVSIHDSTATTTSSTGSQHKGFLEALGDLFLPDEDRYTYAEGMRRGGSVLTVRAEESEFDRISDILEESAVDLDSRESEWRAEGWAGYAGSTEGATGYSRSGSTTAATASRASAGGDYIPVTREDLRVGKREVNHGRVRIRSYVVETPVEEHVSLREEHVHLDRRPVDRAVSSADNVFQNRTIEADERAEEAVVAKEARVVEEVRLSKDVEQRDQTVRDTVRHTEVEVEDERSTGALSEADRLRKTRGY